jgi:hypothetical protein
MNQTTYNTLVYCIRQKQTIRAWGNLRRGKGVHGKGKGEKINRSDFNNSLFPYL